MTTGADHGEIAEVGSPVLVTTDAIDGDRPLRWTSVTIATAAAFLALTNAPTIGNWLDALPQGAVIERLRSLVLGWERTTTALGGPHRWMQTQWRTAKAWRFGDEQPGEQGAIDAP